MHLRRTPVVGLALLGLATVALACTLQAEKGTGSRPVSTGFALLELFTSEG